MIGLSTTTRGLIHGFGFAGAGFMMGPAVGAILGELVTDGGSVTPIDAFSIGRYASAKRDKPAVPDALHALIAVKSTASGRPAAQPF